MRKKSIGRRTFIHKSTAGLAGTALFTKAAVTSFHGNIVKRVDTPAILGGTPIRKKPFPSWPILANGAEENILTVLSSRKWCRLGGSYVDEFEKKFAEIIGVEYCATANSGTNALYTALNAIGIGPGDEVITSVYSFIAPTNVILDLFALPVFVDSDPETFQLDTDLLEDAITEETKAIMPVDIAGAPCNIEKVMSIAKKYNIPVVDDAAQAHLAEFKYKKIGAWADLSIFSHQVSKPLGCGEGGSITGNNKELIRKCAAFVNNGRDPLRIKAGWAYPGINNRMTEFQGALLLKQLDNLDEQVTLREQNANYLVELLKEFPGIKPQKSHEGTTRRSYYYFPMQYDKKYFQNLPKNTFLKAVRAEGIGIRSDSWRPNEEPMIEEHFSSRGFQRVYSKERLDRYRKSKSCPVNDNLVKNMIRIPGAALLGTKKDMEDIADAIRKITKNAKKLL